LLPFALNMALAVLSTDTRQTSGTCPEMVMEDMPGAAWTTAADAMMLGMARANALFCK
jgi:hypothetical protein